MSIREHEQSQREWRRHLRATGRLEGGTLTDERTELDTSQGDHDRFKHYVYHPERGRAAALVTEAMVTGVPVRALCGKMWVPSHNPDRYPICPECKEIKKAAQGGL